MKNALFMQPLHQSFLHPFGVQKLLNSFPGVSLRSTPGYSLAPFQGAAFHNSKDGAEFRNPEGCRPYSNISRNPKGYSTDLISFGNPEGCQRVAGGRSEAETSGCIAIKISTPKGCQKT
jgi:hypothetical protein